MFEPYNITILTHTLIYYIDNTKQVILATANGPEWLKYEVKWLLGILLDAVFFDLTWMSGAHFPTWINVHPSMDK